MRLRVGDDGRVGLDPSGLTLTDAQRRALAFDRELVVSAGAGAGKTHTLALRYVSLLLALADAGIDDVERVLVLTFTDKAASEMADRCRHTLRELIVAARDARAELDGSVGGRAQRGTRLVAALLRMEERFEHARIGTFHAFCASILREFPAQTRSPPGSSPLPAGEARAWVDRALRDTLREHIAATPTDIEPLLDAFGSQAGLLDAGRIALGRLGLLEDVLSRHARGQLTIDDAVAGARTTAAEAERWTVDVGLPTLTLLRRLVAPSGGGSFVERALAPALAELPEARDPAVDPLRAFGRYREVLGVLITDQGTLRSLDHHSVLGTRDRWPDDRRYRMAKEAARALAARIGDWADRARAAALLPTGADQALLAALAPFARWVLAASRSLAGTLDRERRTTFEELQRRAVRAAAEDRALLAALRARYRYVMVDEFQDTDAMQWSLVLGLARADPSVAEDRLFLVGDPKQAIYGFRGGDVSVFRRAVDALGVTPIVLGDNFRSRPALIAWFNAVFPSVLGGALGDDGRPVAAYDPLHAGRTDLGPGDDPGEIVLIRSEPAERGAGGAGGAGATADRLADATARWIAARLAADPRLHASRLPPIAVLLRSRTRQSRYEAALRRLGVPYVVVSGVGFWARPEVLDVVNVLCAIAHGDPLSIVGALRAPLVGLTDTAVGRAVTGEDGVDGAAERWLGPWRALARLVPPSVVARAIGDASIPALTAADPSGRAIANVDQLVAWIAPWDALGLAAVADRLAAEVDAEQRESEATLVPTASRVVVSTVHAAKGLEFPIVVVPELSARPRSDAPALVAARLGAPGDPHPGYRIASRVLDPDAAVQVRVRPGLYSAVTDTLRREADAEERRLLYVACTRARDTLVLVGATQPPAEPGARASWMQLVEGSLPRQTTILDAATLEPPSPAPPSTRVTARPTRLGPVPVRRRLELSASALGQLAACPARWYRGDLLGLAESPATVRDRRVALAAARGRVVHQALQDGVHTAPDVVRTRWLAAAREIGADPGELDAGTERVLAHLDATASDPHVVRAIAAHGWSELPVRARHGDVTLVGRIDRLWRDDEAGGYVVLDWKSVGLHGRDPASVASEHASQLQGYAWAADRVLRARGEAGVVRIEVVLTELGRSVVVGGWSDADRRQVEAQLALASDIASQPWSAVEQAAIDRDPPPPCAGCGFFGRGCAGRRAPSPG